MKTSGESPSRPDPGTHDPVPYETVAGPDGIVCERPAAPPALTPTAAGLLLALLDLDPANPPAPLTGRLDGTAAA